MAFNDLYRVSWLGRVHGQRTVNTFYYNLFAGGAGDDEPTITGALDAGFVVLVEPALLGVMSNVWVRERIIVTNVSVFPTLGFETVHPLASGTVVSVSLPSSVSVVLSRRTTVGGRRGRGRVYLGGVPQTFTAESALTVAGQTAYSNVIPALSQNVVSGGKTYAPRHAFRNAPNARTLTPATISRWLVDPNLRSQRRRQIGVGE